VKKTVTQKALSALGISFRLIHNDEPVFSTKGDSNFENAFFEIFKNETRFEIFKYEKNIGAGMKIVICHSSPDVFFNNRRFQELFVNARPVAVSFFYASADSGIRNYISPGRYPLIYFFLDIDPGQIDVNIHPAKKEIRFYDNSEIFNIFHSATAEAFSKQTRKEIVNDIPWIETGITSAGQQELAGLRDGSRSMEYFEKVISSAGTSGIDDRYSDEDAGYQILGCVFDTYIIVLKENKVLFIDQHAASEAILFRMKKEKQKTHSDNESLIIPAVFEIDNWTDGIDERIKLLNSSGFILERGEGSSLTLKKAPSVFFGRKDYDEAVEMIREFLQNEKTVASKDIIDELLIMASCREAVKKGDKLNLIEMAEIVNEYMRLGITNCPHGRPSHFEITKDSLEKTFQRKK
jgi:DNA mismatch repair protein MutL